MSFTDSKDGQEWWARVEVIKPHLESYKDSFVCCTHIIEKIQRQINKPRDDIQVVVLGNLFQQLWDNVPDDKRITSYPEWFTICELAAPYSEVF